ncbi:MAG: transposase [Pseudodesulfovibrio sp.]
MQAAIGRDVDIASASTLCRFENRVGEESLWALSGVLADVSIESFDSPPEEIELDFDSTDDRGHGDQEGRLLLSGLAYTLLNAIRRPGLVGTGMARARCDTIRLRLLKIGAAVIHNTWRGRLLLPDSYPHKDLFRLVAVRMCPG